MKKFTIDSMSVLFTFGKYKGKTIQYVFEFDVEYLAGLIDREHVYCDDEIRKNINWKCTTI